MLTIEEIKVPGFEKVIEGKDPEVGLHCLIAIHNTTLGPALGGLRIYPYNSKKEALNDVLRLAEGMTYKSALAENGLGGGKSVILLESGKNKTKELLYSFAKVVDSLKGDYIAAEDLGATLSDITLIHERTPYVAAIASKKSSGDPSTFTARGVFKGIQAVLKKLNGSDSIKGKKIAIMGLGSVGSKLANLLFWEGADLIVSDLNHELVEQYVHDFGAISVKPDEIFSVDCDIFSPCALGGILNPQTIAKLRCKAIAGSANNQLLDKSQGLELMQRKILYAPDYIINSGGIINAAAEFEPNGYDPKSARDKVDHLYEILINLFNQAEKNHIPTNLIADQIAEHNIKNLIGKRKHKIAFQ